MNLVIAHSAQIAFAVSRALNCTDRTENGDYTNDTGSIVITSVESSLVEPAPFQYYAGGSDFIKTLPFIPKKRYLYGIRADNVGGKFKVSDEGQKHGRQASGSLSSRPQRSSSPQTTEVRLRLYSLFYVRQQKPDAVSAVCG